MVGVVTVGRRVHWPEEKKSEIKREREEEEKRKSESQRWYPRKRGRTHVN